MCNCNHQKDKETEFEKLGTMFWMLLPFLMMNNSDNKLEARLSILEDEVNALKKII